MTGVQTCALPICIVVLTLVLCAFATEVVRVEPHVSHSDRKAIEKKAEEKFALELQKTRKHQDHLKQHIEKQLAVLKQNKETYEKVAASALDEKKAAETEVSKIVADLKKLESKPAQARLDAKKTNSTSEQTDKMVKEAIKKSIEEGKKMRKELTKKNRNIEKIAKRLAKYNRKVASATKEYKRVEYKLTRLNTKIANSKKDIEVKKTQYKNRAMRQLERIAREKAIKHYIKKIERRLDEVEDEEERKKLVNKQKVAGVMLVKIAARVKIHKTRKAQRKARWAQIAATLKDLKTYRKGWKYDQKLRVLEVVKAKAAVNAVQKNIETVIRNAKRTGKLDSVELDKLATKKATAMKTLEKARAQLEDFKEKGEKRIRQYKMRVLRLKEADAKIRISEHQLSKDAAKATKKEYSDRILKLKKLQRRMGLCPLNRLRIKRRLRVYRKEVKIARMKIKRNNKRIHILRVRMMSLERRMRHIEKKRIAKIIRIMAHLKAKLGRIRQHIMSVRMRKDSKNKEYQMVKVRSLQSKEKQLKSTLKRFVRRNAHTLRKLEQLRKEELEAAKQYYRMKKVAMKRLNVLIGRLGRKIAYLKRKIGAFKHAPIRQVKLARAMRHLVKLYEQAKKDRKDLKTKKDVAKARFVALKTKAINRLHVTRSELSAKQSWLLNELRSLAKREKDVHKHMKKTTQKKELKADMKQMTFIRKEGKEIQKKLYNVVKKAQKVNQLFLRHNQYTAIRRIKVIFKKYIKKFEAFEQQKKEINLRIRKYKMQQNQIFKREPYAKCESAKKELKSEMSMVKRNLADALTDLETVKKQEKRSIFRALKLSKEYIGLLNVKLSDLKIRLAQKQKERPIVSKTALYTTDNKKQRHAVRRLKVVDAKIEELDHSISGTVRKIRKTTYVAGKLRAALAPEGKKCKKMTNCKICRKLGKVAKFGLLHHENDSIIISRLRGVCSRISADRQKECFTQAMTIAQKALHTFDPEKFEVTSVCSSIGKC
mgnify:CR=1 FL=1